MVTPQFFDPDELELLRGTMRPDFQFIDLGANVGTYTLFVGRLVGPGSRILAIEPQAEALERLHENLALNEVDAQIAPVAVGDAEGEVEFVVDPTTSASPRSTCSARARRTAHRAPAGASPDRPRARGGL